MGKRSSDFERKPRDFYPTPYEAVIPLLSHLEPNTHFAEPCAGDGALVRHLEKHGHQPMLVSDIEPRAYAIGKLDVFGVGSDCLIGDGFITNPPWDRKILHPLIIHLSDIAPTWLLFDADWAHTNQSIEFMSRCEKIVSVGRVKWIPDSKMTGKDNCAWYLFKKDPLIITQFWGRT